MDCCNNKNPGDWRIVSCIELKYWERCRPERKLGNSRRLVGLVEWSKFWKRGSMLSSISGENRWRRPVRRPIEHIKERRQFLHLTLLFCFTRLTDDYLLPKPVCYVILNARLWAVHGLTWSSSFLYAAWRRNSESEDWKIVTLLIYRRLFPWTELENYTCVSMEG